MPHVRRACRCGLIWIALALLSPGWVQWARAEAPPIATSIGADDVPEARRTPQRLYVTAREAHAAVMTRKDVLLIDVRTPGETIFSGFAAPMTRNIPYVVIEDGHAYDAKTRRYKLVPNQDFPKAVELLIAERGLGADVVLILYCSVGDRSAKAAALLANSGHRNVYTMVDGFDGDPAAGLPMLGWSRAGLPVSFALTEDQSYHSPTM